MPAGRNQLSSRWRGIVKAVKAGNGLWYTTRGEEEDDDLLRSTCITQHVLRSFRRVTQISVSVLLFSDKPSRRAVSASFSSFVCYGTE
jgi:hypothetical protein